ncbi:MAG: hypothetical protein JWR52_3497 [Marmoricola sp.]|nr:hypothetical protein [Marmoricola sp.]
MLDPALLNQVALQALGLLEHKRDVQAGRERGFIGAVAWFFTVAPRVRQAAGLSPKTASGVAVASVVVVLQGIFITALGGALVVPLLHWFGWS